MYAYINQILSIPAHYLYDEWKLMSYSNYLKRCQRGRLVRTKTGKGEGNVAFVSYESLPFEYKTICIREFGDPRKVAKRNELEKFIQPDIDAARFFAAHRKNNGQQLSQDVQIERVTNCCIMNAIKEVLDEKATNAKAFGSKTQQIWKNISNAVNQLDDEKWVFKLPGAWSRLRERYNEYIQYGYSIFIHKNEGNQFAVSIGEENGDWLLAQYSLPIKLTVPELHTEYQKARILNNWPDLSETAIKNFLKKPANERIWTIARDGIEAYNRKYKHTLTRRRFDWFPNAYWAIDGTKLDMVYFDENTSTKMNAALKIDVVFDVFSEKILGYSLSTTENHTDHFAAIRQAVNRAGCRPYLFTYDQQSGHKMGRMQNFYSSLVAKDKGTHYCHRSRAHNSPAEQLFDRVQSQVIKKFWFHDGQGITTKTDQAKANWDFIEENKHKLPTMEEVKKAFVAAVNIWNSNKHPKYDETRDMVYNGHKQKKREELSLIEIVDQMWIAETKKPITYKGHGLDMWLNGEKYQFEVYDADGNIDINFRQYNVGKKFIVRYDPANLDAYVQLCEEDAHGNIVFVRNASPKREHQVVPALMHPGDKEQWHKDHAIRDEELERDRAALADLQKRTGITPEKLIADTEMMVKMGGRIPKEDRNEIDNRKRALMQI